MLLPFRWLLYGTASAAAVIEKGTRKHPKIQRKLRRLARWSEAIAPPRIAVVVSPPLQPFVSSTLQLVSGTLVITRHVAVYNKGPVIAAASLADFTGIDVSLPESRIENRESRIVSGEITANIDLFEEEYLMLLAAR